MCRQKGIPVINIRWLHFCVIFKFLLSTETFDLARHPTFDFSSTEKLVDSLKVDNSVEAAISSMKIVDAFITASLMKKKPCDV